MGKNITPATFPSPTGDDEKAKAKYVADIYLYAANKAEEAINWYFVKKASKQQMAQCLRFSAIIFTTVGGLVPLIIASHIIPPSTGTATQPAIEYGQFGYIALALAGACVFLDKFFGFSSGWIRYITSALKLQRIREEFNVDWALLNSSKQLSPPNAAEREAMLKRVQAFLQSVLSEVESETAAWAAEYRSNLSELDKNARQQIEANKPGVINLTVKNAAAFTSGVTVLLDGVPRQTIMASDCQISPVFPGDHFVEVRAKANGKEISAGGAVRLEPGHSVPLALSLATPDS